MRIALLATFLLALLTQTAQAQKEFGFDNRKSSGQPYLKPEETVARFKVAPEFEVKLFAGEPQLVNPIAFTIDEKGRTWVVECFEYPSKAGKKVPRDRIVILEDTDGDGVCDKRTVFAEGKDFPVTDERKKAGLGAFDMASGIEVGHGGVFVGAPPYLWFIENNNDKPGKFEVLLKGFGSQDTHETLNTFQWGPDGWLYGLHGIFTDSKVQSAGQLDGPETRINGGIWRYYQREKKFEIFAEGTSNPWGMDWRNTDGQFILACCVIPHLYHIVPGGIYKRQAGASFNPYAYSYINEISDHTFHKESGWAHAGLISLDVPHMPEKYRNSVIFGSIHGCSLKQNILRPNGSSYIASRGEDFLVSGDKNFRPINMKWGPNGDIFLIDWHDQNPCHQAAADSWDYERGRIYRIQLKGTKTKKAEDLGKKTSAELAKIVMEDSNPYRVRKSLQLLAAQPGHPFARGPLVEPPIPQAEIDLLESGLAGSDPVQHIRAMWLMSAIPFHDTKFNHANSVVRAWAARLMHVNEIGPLDESKLATELVSNEKNANVRREIASTAIALADYLNSSGVPEKDKRDVKPLIRELMAHQEDANDPIIPQLVWLAYEKAIASKKSSIDNELTWLAEQSPDNIFVRDHIVPKVMRRLVATRDPANLKLCIQFVATLKDTHSREKALDGLTIALTGVTLPPPPGWTELQAKIREGKEPKLIALIDKMAVSFRDPAAIQRAVSIAVNTALATTERVEAIRQLGSLRAKETLPIVLKLVLADTVIAVRAEAARALAAYDDAKVPNEIIPRWSTFPKEIRTDLVNTLASRKEWARALLNAMAAGKIERTAATDNTIQRIQAFEDTGLNKLIETAWGRARATPADLAKTIDKIRLSLFEAPGSFEKGRTVFENNCAKCHKFEGKGNDVGPALDGAARDIEYILVNVIDPNRVIGAPYFLRTARLLDGTIQQGVLSSEDDKVIVLKQENGVLRTIAKADLDGAVQVVEKSLMPEGLGYNMSPQDFRDLVRYLMANPFLTDVTINGAKFEVGVPGRIVLPDTKGAPAVVQAKVLAPKKLTTTLLISSSADFEVRLNGKSIGTGKGSGKEIRPDENSFEVTLAEGSHTIAVVAKSGGGVVYARMSDPDRILKLED